MSRHFLTRKSRDRPQMATDGHRWPQMATDSHDSLEKYPKSVTLVTNWSEFDAFDEAVSLESSHCSRFYLAEKSSSIKQQQWLDWAFGAFQTVSLPCNEHNFLKATQVRWRKQLRYADSRWDKAGCALIDFWRNYSSFQHFGREHPQAFSVISTGIFYLKFPKSARCSSHRSYYKTSKLQVLECIPIMWTEWESREKNQIEASCSSTMCHIGIVLTWFTIFANSRSAENAVE